MANLYHEPYESSSFIQELGKAHRLVTAMRAVSGQTQGQGDIGAEIL